MGEIRSIVELITYLRSQQVLLSLEGEALKCNAPKGVLTPELRDELKLRKPELITFLRNSRDAARAGGSGITQADRSGPLAPSLAQQRLWFLTQLDPEDPAYNVSTAMRLVGKLHADAIESALRAIMSRHESLHTTFTQTDGMPQLIVHDQYDWKLVKADFTHLTEQAREQAIRDFFIDRTREPFDLSICPLFRATLVQLAPEEHVLMLVMHHIISDGWSLGIFVHEFAEFYRCAIEDRPPLLAPLPIQYADFADWQRRWLEGGELDRQLPYWTNHLAGAPPVVQFPPDHRKLPGQTAQGHRHLTILPSELVADLEQIGRREGVTLFMLMLAAFNVLLYRYSGQKDVVVGSPSANRNRTELQGVFGFFTNNLVLRTSLEGNPRFNELLARVREVTLQAYEHQDVPFDRLVQALRPERSIEHSPIFQTLFSLQTFPLEDLTLSGLTITPIEFDTTPARFDVSIEIYPRHGELRIYFEFNKLLYEGQTIERIRRHFLRLLQAIVEDPGQHIDLIPLLGADEYREIVEDWNATQIEHKDAMCFHQKFEAQAVANPDRIAVVAGQQSLTYCELNARANQIAHTLRFHGIGHEVLVGVYMERSVDMLAALLGVMKSGGAYVPLDPIYPSHRIDSILEDAQPRVILTSTSLSEMLPHFSGHMLCLDTLPFPTDAEQCANPVSLATLNSLAYVIFTSGSTGRPKGVQIEHAALRNFLDSMALEPGFSRDDVLLAVTTISFDIAGLELYLPLMVGGRVCIALEPGNVVSLMDELIRLRPTVMQATPATWQLLLNAGWQGDTRMRILCGGEALESRLAMALTTRAESVWNMYGPTETTIWSSALKLNGLEGGTVPVGSPIANTSFYIVNAHRQPVPIGVAGELLIGGEGLARGYLHRAELTAEKFINDPFSNIPGTRLYCTGDLVRYRQDGTIEFLGRLDHQVKLRGFRIELGEIENVLRQQQGVLDAVVLLREIGGDKHLIAWILSESTVHDLSLLRNALRQLLPEYMVPSRIVQIEELPRTPNGKLDRGALVVPAHAEHSRSHVRSQFLTPMQESVARVFRELLALESVGPDDNFFDLGAHSLLIVRVHERLKRDVDPQLTLINFFQYPTVGSLAEFLDKRLLHSGQAATAS